MATKPPADTSPTPTPAERVVLTGIGVVCPLGADRETSWRAALAGQRCVQQLRFPLRSGEWIGLGAPAPVAEPVEPSQRLPHFALAAAREAILHAGLDASPTNADWEFGCSLGNSKGNLASLQANLLHLSNKEPIDGEEWLRFFPSSLATQVAHTFQLGGPISCPVGACATGLMAVAQAASWIQSGRCERVLAGSADASLTPMILGSFTRLGVLAPSSDPEPASAIRPFAANRQGFAVGEGAACFVVESLTSARRRGANPIAELVGWSLKGDAASITGMSPTPEPLQRAIEATLQQAQLSPSQVTHVNCHGTATAMNDVWESTGIAQAFGSHAKSLHLSANKAQIGHLLGAAGSVELAFTALALRDGIVPPTMNLQQRDPQCGLNYTPLRSLAVPINTALKISLGFGGHVSVAALRRVEPA